MSSEAIFLYKNPTPNSRGAFGAMFLLELLRLHWTWFRVNSEFGR